MIHTMHTWSVKSETLRLKNSTWYLNDFIRLPIRYNYCYRLLMVCENHDETTKQPLRNLHDQSKSCVSDSICNVYENQLPASAYPKYATHCLNCCRAYIFCRFAMYLSELLRIHPGFAPPLCIQDYDADGAVFADCNDPDKFLYGRLTQ